MVQRILFYVGLDLLKRVSILIMQKVSFFSRQHQPICLTIRYRMKIIYKCLDGKINREVGGTQWKFSNSAWNMRIVACSPNT